MNFKVIGNKIIVKQLESEKKTKSGILLPDSAKEKPSEGKVIQVGKGKLLKDGSREDMEVKVGDKVIFSKYGGVEVKIKAEKYLILRLDDILIVLK